MCSISRHHGVLKAKIAGLALLGALGMTPAQAQAVAIDSAIIADPVTGTALMGYDVVSYFIDNKAIPGDVGQQVSHAGRAWYFSSLANRLVFENKPESFVPAFGGYDPAALAAGVIRQGDPRIFLQWQGKLYFFRDKEARDRVLAKPDIIEAAAREWPGLKRDLDP
ncbi:MAG: hypothetical protein LCH39_15035 [Proteobacteria bacterium]|nr:hypothetical protein [Pseudomonadota bacterium]